MQSKYIRITQVVLHKWSFRVVTLVLKFAWTDLSIVGFTGPPVLILCS